MKASGGSARRLEALAVLVLFAASFSAVPVARSAATPANHIPMVGLDVNYVVPQSFIDNLASQGETWIRQFGPNQNTPMIHDAGMKILMVLNENAFVVNSSYARYTDVRNMTTAQWYDLVLQTAKAYPYITTWEFLNEPTNLGCGAPACPDWTPQQYFEYLVPTYRALEAANPNNILVGPTLQVWPYLCCSTFDPYSLQWFQTLWGMNDPATGLSASRMFAYVSLHIYTSGNMISDVMTRGPYAGRTVGYAVAQGLSQYYQVTGNSKGIIIDEFGMPTDAGGYAAGPPYAPAKIQPSDATQATYYQQVMDLFEGIPYVQGVFAFDWSDYGQGGAGMMGLFDSSLQPKAAWQVYRQYFPSGGNVRITPSTPGAAGQPSFGRATVTVQSDWLNGTSFGGIYTEVKSNGESVGSGLTPLTVAVPNGSSYVVTFFYFPPFDYGRVALDHLSTGNRSNVADLKVNGTTAVTAFYVPGSPSPSQASPGAAGRALLPLLLVWGAAGGLGLATILFLERPSFIRKRGPDPLPPPSRGQSRPAVALRSLGRAVRRLSLHLTNRS